jgi:predicted RNase H-like HicB family nuclease
MAVDRKLLELARCRPWALRFDDALDLCRALGFQKVRQVRAHRVFRHPARPARPFSLQQGARGHAKAWQVSRLLHPDAPARAGASRQGDDGRTVHVSWSDLDGECVATCAELPGLSGLAPTPERAIAELRVALDAWLDYVAASTVRRA